MESASLEPGREYLGPVSLSCPITGVSFDVPDGWIARQPDAGLAIYLGSGLAPGVGLVFFHNSLIRDELNQLLSETVAIDHGLRLKPVAEPHQDGDLMVQRYVADDIVGRAHGLIGSTGAGIVTLFFGPPEIQAEVESIVKTVTDTAEFQPGGANDVVAEWTHWLAGRQIGFEVQMEDSPAAGKTMPVEINLFDDGEYLLAEDPDSTNGYEERGKWRVEVWSTSPLLVLENSSGSMDVFNIARDGEEMTLNGQSAAVASASSHSPQA